MIPQATDDFWARLGQLPFVTSPLLEKCRNHAGGQKASWESLCELICHHTPLEKVHLKRIETPDSLPLIIGDYLIEKRLPHSCMWLSLLGKDIKNGKKVRLSEVPASVSETDRQQIAVHQNLLKSQPRDSFVQSIGSVNDSGRLFLVSQIPSGAPLLGLVGSKHDSRALVSDTVSALIEWNQWCQQNQSNSTDPLLLPIDPIHLRYSSGRREVTLDLPECGFLFRPESAGYRWASEKEEKLWNEFSNLKSNSKKSMLSNLERSQQLLKYLSAKVGNDLEAAKVLEEMAKEVGEMAAGRESNWDRMRSMLSGLQQREASSGVETSSPGSIKVNVGSGGRSKRPGSKGPKKKAVTNVKDRQFKNWMLGILIPTPIVLILFFAWFHFFPGSPKSTGSKDPGQAKPVTLKKVDGDKQKKEPALSLNPDSLALDAEGETNSDSEIEVGSEGEELQTGGLIADLADAAMDDQDKSLLGEKSTTTKTSSETIPGVKASTNSEDEEKDTNNLADGQGQDGKEQSKQVESVAADQQQEKDGYDDFVTVEDLLNAVSLQKLVEEGSGGSPLQWELGKLNELSAQNLQLDWEVLWQQDGVEWLVEEDDPGADSRRLWKIVRKATGEPNVVAAHLNAMKDGRLLLKVEAQNVGPAQPLAYSKASFSFQNEDGDEVNHQIKMVASKQISPLPINSKGIVKTWESDLPLDGLKFRTKFFLGSDKPLEKLTKGSPEAKALKVKKGESVYFLGTQPSVGSVILRIAKNSGKKFKIRAKLEFITPSGAVRLTKKVIPTAIASLLAESARVKNELARVKAKRAKSGQGARKKQIISNLEGKLEVNEELVENLTKQQAVAEQVFQSGLHFQVQLLGAEGGVTIIETIPQTEQ